jgi:hypothetical protein
MENYEQNVTFFAFFLHIICIMYYFAYYNAYHAYYFASYNTHSAYMHIL